MFSRLTHLSQPSFSNEEHTFNNENQDYSNRTPQVSFKNSVHLKKAPSTDRLITKMSSEYTNEGSHLLKSSLSNSNLHEGAHSSLRRSQEGNFLRTSQGNGLGSSMSFASMKMGLKSSMSRQMMAADRRLKNQALDDIMKSSIRGTEMTTSIRVNQIPCSSQDGKRAKYRLISSNDPQNMFYCSKCSIALIQQGYKVEQISSNKVDVFKRKQECRQFVQRLQESENRLREQIMKLQCERYTQSLQQRLQKVEEVYDVIILIIQQMKVKDSETTRKSMQQAHRIRGQEINSLKNQLDNLMEIKKFIWAAINHSIKQLPENEYRSLLEHNMQPLKEAQSYKPLVLMVKDEPISKILETIFYQISEHFQSMKIGRGNLSNISSNIIQEQSDDFTLSDLKQKPFRNLFTEEDISFNR